MELCSMTVTQAAMQRKSTRLCANLDGTWIGYRLFTPMDHRRHGGVAAGVIGESLNSWMVNRLSLTFFINSHKIGEDISQVIVWHNGSLIQKIQFITDKGKLASYAEKIVSYMCQSGRKSDMFGSWGDSMVVWECDGLAFAGFAGASGGWVMEGLMACSLLCSISVS
jgi:hypothetical protein